MSFLMIAGFFVGCRSTKTIQNAMAKKDSVKIAGPAHDTHLDSVQFMHSIYEGVISKKINYNSFSAKIKVDFEGSDGKKNDFNANIRLQRDSILWISINALLGIEAFRVIITPDSVKVLNKLDKVVQLRSVNYLQEITRIPFTFAELQDLLVGNPIYFDSNIVSYKHEAASITIVSVGQLFKHLLTVNPVNYQMQHSKLDDINNARARTADITYGDYENYSNFLFSTSRKITVSEKSKLEIEMKFRQYDFNVPLNFPFNIPKNYKLQ
jgi:Domain of unknown function (DUF4292)